MNKLLQRLAIVYGKPDHTDPAPYFAELDRLMKGYCEEELNKAADLIIREHKGKTWPPVNAMIVACADARELINGAQPIVDNRFPEWTKKRRAFAFKALESEVGRRASKEGWILGLEKFLREQGRAPNEREISDLKKSARGFDEAYTAVMNGQGGALAPALERLGDQMLKRRDDYSAIAHGDRSHADKVLRGA